MKFIKLEDNNEFVHIKIKVEFLGAWKYIYIVTLMPEIEFRYRSDLPVIPHEHPINQASKLIGSSNNWDFQLLNQSNMDLDYEVRIDWFQGTDENPIDSWVHDSATEGKFKQGEDPKRFPFSCKYIK